jgi:2,4'-dihydroxyacetophenone dioxygenase
MADAAEDQTRVVPGAGIPWVWMGNEESRVEMKLLKCGREDGVYSFLNRFHPGFQAPRHLHLGEVHAYTIQGSWHYLEYDWVSGPGDYVYEPPNTTHTLNVPADANEPTIVFFTVAKGMDLYTPDGDVLMTLDAAVLEALYRAGLDARGLDFPKSIVL